MWQLLRVVASWGSGAVAVALAVIYLLIGLLWRWVNAVEAFGLGFGYGHLLYARMCFGTV